MIGFRYLLPAEEEMTEAAKLHVKQAQGLGAGFLDDVQNCIDRLRENPMLGQIVVDNRSRLNSIVMCETN